MNTKTTSPNQKVEAHSQHAILSDIHEMKPSEADSSLPVRKILDQKYEIKKTIGEGRYAK